MSNGEAIDLAAYPTVRWRTREGGAGEWAAVSMTTLRAGRQTLEYQIHRRGRETAVVVIDLVVKEP